MISIKQERTGNYVPIRDERFWADVMIYSPLVVETQAEADYLWAMQLMTGKTYQIWLNGRDYLPGMDAELPPSFIRIDLPLQ